MMGKPWLGLSESRTLRGITVLKTLSPRCLRTSSLTRCASKLRESNIVSKMPAKDSDGFKFVFTIFMVLSKYPNPSMAKYSHCRGTIKESAATRALTVIKPSDGGQSIIIKSYCLSKDFNKRRKRFSRSSISVSYTHLRAHETRHDL